MRIFRSGAASVAVLVLAACGSGHSGSGDRRAAVNEYFARLNVAQATLTNESSTINAAFRSFSTSDNRPAEVRALRHAEHELLLARRSVIRIKPPAEARRLHADLVRLLGVEASLAGELLSTARYAPQLKQALRPLRPAGARFSRDLRRAKHWREQAAAFERYRSSLAAVSAALERLHAPPILRPSLVGERTILRRSVGLCASAAEALKRHDAHTAALRVRTLSGLALGSTAVRARRDQIVAARAYNRRIAVVSALAAKIARERERLARTLR